MTPYTHETLAAQLEEQARFFESAATSGAREAIEHGTAQAGRLMTRAIRLGALPECKPENFTGLPNPDEFGVEADKWRSIWSLMREVFGQGSVVNREYREPGADGWKTVALGHAAVCRNIARRVRAARKPAPPVNADGDSTIIDAAIDMVATELKKKPADLRVYLILKEYPDMSCRKAAKLANTNKSKVERLRKKYPNELGMSRTKQAIHDRKEKFLGTGR